MSVIADSPLPSSSSEDFAAFLDDELDSESSDTSPNEENDDSDSSERSKRRKVELESTVEVGSTSYGSFEQKTEVIADVSCLHPGDFRDLCIWCGKKLHNAKGTSLGYIHKDLRLGNDEMTRLRNADVKKMLQQKKLYLVIDLDHTVLNSTRLEDIKPDEEYLMNQIHSLQDISNGSLFKLDMMRMVTKLRPFVRNFLKEAADLFEMYIYTMGERSYAFEMAKLLDPGKLYFDSRVISQGDCSQRHQKGLDVVLGTDNAVLILDDTEAVWQKHKDNLILMDRYHYFSSSYRQFGISGKSLSELKIDENEEEGQLATVLGVLRRAHSLYFDPEREDDIAVRDVREVLKTVRKEVLKDCKIVFSSVFPRNTDPKANYYWMMAEKMGATCCTEVNPSVTHVVSNEALTDKAKWARKEKKFLVRPQWIEAAKFLWKRQPEDKFSVKEVERRNDQKNFFKDRKPLDFHSLSPKSSSQRDPTSSTQSRSFAQFHCRNWKLMSPKSKDQRKRKRVWCT